MVSKDQNASRLEWPVLLYNVMVSSEPAEGHIRVCGLTAVRVWVDV